MEVATPRKRGRPPKGEEPAPRPLPPLGLKSQGGRPTGLSPQRRSVLLPARIAAHKLRLIEEILASGYAPLEIMFRAMKGDTSITALQLKAAEMAAPFVHRRLAAIHVDALVRQKTGGDVQIAERADLPADPEEAARIYRRLTLDRR